MLKTKKYFKSYNKKKLYEKKIYYGKKTGPAETWTRIFGFKVQGAHHYTTGPAHV